MLDVALIKLHDIPHIFHTLALKHLNLRKFPESSDGRVIFWVVGWELHLITMI